MEAKLQAEDRAARAEEQLVKALSNPSQNDAKKVDDKENDKDKRVD